MTPQILSQIFEAIMLTAFGFSWPISIHKSWSTKFVRGKSPAFLGLIIIGYLAGIFFKIYDAASKGNPVDWTIWLYVANGVMVIVDMWLYFKYRNNHEPVTKAVAADIAHIIEDELEHDKRN
jgi:hypothetical protein